ncbi:hypothetical protein [Streptomyces sp. NPDC050507]|uniref:hypothetical protein n=1 Tax=Streptomyces sp. NPDC050507 TaxID=3365619 RepID=UPI003789A71E
MSFRPSYRRVSLRAAVAAAALGGAVLVPATAAFADTVPAAPAGQGQQATDAGTLIRTDELKGGLTAKVYKHGDQHVYYTAEVLDGAKALGVLTAGGGYAPEESKVFGNGIKVTLDFTGAVTSVVDAGSDGQGPVTPVGTLIRTDELKGGLTAKVYKHGDQHVYYTAEVLDGAKALGVLTAGGGYAPEESRVFGNGIKVTLDFTGAVTSVVDAGSDGQGPVTPVECVATVTKSIGAGTLAELSISPSGPSVVFQGGDGKVLGQLSRLHPALPASAGFLGEIINPSSTAPQLRTNMEGGGHPASVTDFPKLPKGCSFTYATTSGNSTSGDGTSANGTETQTSQTSQTSVVPKGSVAAGAEVEQNGSPVLIAVGGAAAVGAAGLGFVLMRRRAAASAR